MWSFLPVQRKKIYLEISLLELEKQLPLFFFRCNRSSIVNLLFVNIYETKKKNYILHTVSGKKFPVSLRNRKTFKSKFLYLKQHDFYSENCIMCKRAWVGKLNN